MKPVSDFEDGWNVILSKGSGVPSHPFPFVGEWLSLVEHLVRDQGVGGSNPLSPTKSLKQLHAKFEHLFGRNWAQLAISLPVRSVQSPTLPSEPSSCGTMCCFSFPRER